MELDIKDLTFYDFRKASSIGERCDSHAQRYLSMAHFYENSSTTLK